MIRARRYPRYIDFPRAEPDEKKNVISRESARGPHFSGEKIRCSEKVPVGADELFPGARLFPLGAGERPCRFKMFPTV